MALVLAIANQKGGVGKTTTAVNLSASLAASEKRVLLVDLDPQGNATSGLGLKREEVSDQPTIYHALLGEHDARSAVVETEVPHLSLLPSDPDLVGAELELVSVMARESRLQKALASLRGEFDYVILDCPPSLGLLTINALVAADRVLVPLQCEYYALEGLGSLLRTIELIRANLNRELELDGVLLTMFDARNNLARQVTRDVEANMPGRVYKTVIPRNVRLSEAPSHGRPVILYDIESKGAQSYLALAGEMLSRHAAQRPTTGKDDGRAKPVRLPERARK
ncbi:MAG: AAA family ATPase [Myxococcales bacterium]